MKIIKNWLFCNRKLNSTGRFVPCSLNLDTIVEIVDRNGHIAIIIDYDGNMIQTDVDTITFMSKFQKYLLNN